MEGLMGICNYFASKNCYPDVRKFGSVQEKKPGRKLLKLPAGEELRKLDEICKKCAIRLFEIETKKCPVCENEDIILSSIVNIESQFGSMKGNLYRCNKCNTKLLSDKIL